ncbi:aldo/keto reductase [Actinacidiphila sp. DG2A-62]|uniref:aldo/keto reductase n=1 Tax=Actinacidiphila sp. DG2A-62 TaxID=3108821 RepID=UPI002DBE706F|nr:aldo/keto reductase [Actinacidiphila sp. DG2A-62]MEC3995129.1 aldo/keto reductase [Actinacidiphila sp. DG2A-62]
MDMRHLPGLDRDVSAIGAGCWTIGGSATNRGVPIGWAGVDEGRAFEGLGRAFDLGITLYDTADVYGMGQSERLVGRLLRQIDRKRVVVCSKVGFFAGTAVHPYEHRQILRQFETTTENLGTGYLDVYFLHSPDFGPGDRYLDQAVETVGGLRAEARVRAVGMRAPHEFTEQWAADPHHPHGPRIARWLELFDRIRPDVLAVRHSTLSPLYGPQETDIFRFARRHGVGVLMKQVLGQGLLTGAYDPRRPPAFPPGDHRRGDPRFAVDVLDALHAALSELQRQLGPDCSLTRAAVQYALQADPDAVALLGFRDADQITETVTAAERSLTSGDLHAIRQLMEPVREMLFPVPSHTYER